MIQKILFATENEGKMKEIRSILEGIGMEVLSMKEAGIDVDVEENGTTFEENATIKASVPASLGYIGVADDSGLVVDALGGAPGIYSARAEHGGAAFLCPALRGTAAGRRARRGRALLSPCGAKSHSERNR